MPILLHKLSDNMLHRLNDTHIYSVYIYIYCIYTVYQIALKLFENYIIFVIYSFLGNSPASEI